MLTEQKVFEQQVRELTEMMRDLRSTLDKQRADGDKDYREIRRLQSIVRKQLDQEHEYQERLREADAEVELYKRLAHAAIQRERAALANGAVRVNPDDIGGQP